MDDKIEKRHSYSKNKPNVQNYIQLLNKRKVNTILSILSTDTTWTTHSSGSAAPEAHVPITTFVVASIHADERTPQLRTSPSSRAPHTSPDLHPTNLIYPTCSHISKIKGPGLLASTMYSTLWMPKVQAP